MRDVVTKSRRLSLAGRKPRINPESFPQHWPFVRGIHWSPVDCPHTKGQWCRALMLIWCNPEQVIEQTVQFIADLQLVIPVSTDVLTPNGARPSGDTVLIIWVMPHYDHPCVNKSSLSHLMSVLQDTNPIFLFSKSSIEAATPPSASVNYGSGEIAVMAVLPVVFCICNLWLVLVFLLILLIIFLFLFHRLPQP